MVAKSRTDKPALKSLLHQVYFTIFKAAVANSPKVGSTLKYLSCFFSTQVGQSSQVLLVEHCCGALGCPKTFLSVHKECNLEREFITNILWNPREKKVKVKWPLSLLALVLLWTPETLPTCCASAVWAGRSSGLWSCFASRAATSCSGRNVNWRSKDPTTASGTRTKNW